MTEKQVCLNEKEVLFIKELMQKHGEAIGYRDDDAVGFIIYSGLVETLGVKTRTDSGAFIMVRDAPEIHEFLGKLYE